jgi:hypothetical protein
MQEASSVGRVAYIFADGDRTSPRNGRFNGCFHGTTSNSLHPLRGIVGSNWETVQLDDGFRIRMRAISWPWFERKSHIYLPKFAEHHKSYVRPISPILLILLVILLQHILAILVGSIRDLSGLRSRFFGSNMFYPPSFHIFPIPSPLGSQRSCDCVLFSIFPRKSHPQVDRWYLQCPLSITVGKAIIHHPYRDGSKTSRIWQHWGWKFILALPTL